MRNASRWKRRSPRHTACAAIRTTCSASSKEMVEKLGGEISVSSSAEDGTVFQVILCRQTAEKELSLTRKLLCYAAGWLDGQCSALVGQAFVHS